MIYGIILFLACVGLVAYSIIKKRKQEKAIADYAQLQGWTALAHDAATLEQYLPLYLRGLGSSQRYDMAYQATVNGVATVFFQYVYTVYHTENNNATGNNQRTSQDFTFTIVYAPLGHARSNVLLLHHTILSKFTGIGSHWGLEQVKLEGDFNDYFDTYIAPNSQDEALSLLAPDVMALLVDDLKNASLQVNGQAFMLSIETAGLSPDTITPALTGVAAIVTKIDGVAPAVPTLTSAPAAAAMSASQPAAPVAAPVLAPQPAASAPAVPPASASPGQVINPAAEVPVPPAPPQP